jgi:hypothetical protein
MMDKIKDMAGGSNPMELKKYLQGVTWPTGKDNLVNVLRQNNAPDSIVSKVEGVTAIEQYKQDAQGDQAVLQCYESLQEQDRNNIEQLQSLLRSRFTK